MKLFDMHCDTIYECFETRQHLRENTLCINKEQLQGYANYAQFFALFCGAQPPEEERTGRRLLLDLPLENRLYALLDTAQYEFRTNADWLSLCVSGDDLRTAWEQGKAAAFLSLEGAELLVTEDHITRAYEAGVRLVTLAWNTRSQYACGAAIDNDEGLSNRGKALVQALVQMGIIVDVSHLSEAGFWDACVTTEAPLCASHSNSRAVCNHLRNLTDLQFSELIRRGGLVGINLYAPFIVQNEDCTPDDVLRHIEHFCALGGEHILALGCDFDGCSTLPKGIQTVATLDKLAEAMLKRNYLQSTVDNIFYKNLTSYVCRMLQP